MDAVHGTGEHLIEFTIFVIWTLLLPYARDGCSNSLALHGTGEHLIEFTIFVIWTLLLPYARDGCSNSLASVITAYTHPQKGETKYST